MKKSIFAILKEKLQGVGETKKHLFAVYSLQIVFVLLGFLINLLIARFFGKEVFGEYSYFFSLGIILSTFASLGIYKFISTHKFSESVKLYLQSVPVLIASSLVFGFLGAFVPQWLNLNPRISYFVIIVVAYVVFRTLFLSKISPLRAAHKFVQSNVISLFSRVFFLLFIVLGWLYDLKILLFVGLPISFLLLLLYPIPFYRKQETKGLDSGLGSNSGLFSSLSFGLNEGIFSVLIFSSFVFLLQDLSFLLLFHIDRLSIEYILGSVVLGEFNAISTFTNVIRISSGIFPLVLIPLAASKRYKIRKSLFSLLLFLVPFCAVVLFATPILLPLFFGSAFQAPFSLTLALVVSSLLLVVYSFLSSLFLGRKCEKKFVRKVLLWDFALSFIGNIGLNIWFIMAFGVIGAPIATAVVLILKSGLILWAFEHSKRNNLLASDIQAKEVEAVES
ncbi:oligosaccharide flippase family protein [archaeon]|jgi:O-antigen/teichoic acid export membrane protein|nr:oligosaccharide flippase family protein [archaeon]MBT6697563.1 oligosaccharide flippase family protein [archaeon]